MKTKISYLLCLCFLFVLVAPLVSRSHTVIVNSKSGTDSFICCQSLGTACRSLEYALSCISANIIGSYSIVRVDGIASLNKRTELNIPTDYNVTIESENIMPAVINCDSDNSMLIVRSDGRGASIVFRNVLVRNCGPSVPSAVLIEGPLDAEFNSCTFINNTCAGLNIIDANLMVINSQFRNNRLTAAGNLDGEFVLGNDSLGAGLGILFDSGIGMTVEIVSSDFILGSGVVSDKPAIGIPRSSKGKLPSLYTIGGGGLSVIYAFDSHDNSVSVSNCNFEYNRGTYGGGLYFNFLHNSTRNSVLVENCTVARNFVSLTGSGLLISSEDRAHNNTIILKSCNIYSNNAMSGGAMKVTYNSIDPSNVKRGGLMDFQMHNCNVFDNIAMSGSAFRLVSNIPSGRVSQLLPKLYNCTISGHRPARGSKEYPGAIYSTGVGIEFHGMNYFTSNTQGSAIHISSGILHVKGILIFERNIGYEGSAAYLTTSSKLILYPDSYLRISNNHAERRGGGLFVEVTASWQVIYEYNPGCFLQYSEADTLPSKWRVC